MRQNNCEKQLLIKILICITYTLKTNWYRNLVTLNSVSPLLFEVNEHELQFSVNHMKRRWFVCPPKFKMFNEKVNRLKLTFVNLKLKR